jgi:hypothetical protein
MSVVPSHYEVTGEDGHVYHEFDGVGEPAYYGAMEAARQVSFGRPGELIEVVERKVWYSCRTPRDDRPYPSSPSHGDTSSSTGAAKRR